MALEPLKDGIRSLVRIDFYGNVHKRLRGTAAAERYAMEVAVLKVLEQMQVPIDVITGTSMGAIVGGLYASGMRAADLERELRAVQWGEVFANRVERKQLSERALKEQSSVADKAKEELLTVKDPARKRVLNQAMRDGQALVARIALLEGQEETVLKMLDAD